MADMFQNQQGKNAEPTLIAWHVSERGERNYWHRVGAAWNHKDGQGLTITLDTIPVNGRIVLRTPRTPQ